ncbi:MAG: DUF2249 domain-containing protein [Pseudomonadales bacterium]|nr:DUF2249 domain-containing protein [Pseudomonadales bacterium]
MHDARVFVDVSEMPAPEPLAVSTSTAMSLSPGQFLQIHHWREPLLLYERLARNDFGFDVRANGDDFEVFVWRLDDTAAEEAAKAAAAHYPAVRSS